MSVQDPFELNRNITANVTENVFKEWVSELKYAARLASERAFQNKTKDLWGMPLLLCETVSELVSVNNAELPVSTLQLDIPIALRTDLCHCKMGVNSKHLTDIRGVHTNQCLNSVSDIVEDVFFRGFRLCRKPLGSDSAVGDKLPEVAVIDDDDVQVIDVDEPPQKLIALESLTTEPKNTPKDVLCDKRLRKFAFQAYYDTWNDRDAQMKDITSVEDPIAKQASISDRIICKSKMEDGCNEETPLCEYVCSLSPYSKNDECGILTALLPVHTRNSKTIETFNACMAISLPTIVVDMLAYKCNLK